MRIAVLALLLLLSDTAAAARAHMATDDFDGATRVWIDPHGLDCGWQMVCASVGARWTSKAPEAAVVTAELLNEYASVTALHLNIDGTIVELQPTSTPTRFEGRGGARGAPAMRTSGRDFVVPMQMLQDILAANSVKVRVNTSDGFVDGTMADGRRKSKAAAALARFWAKLPDRLPAGSP